MSSNDGGYFAIKGFLYQFDKTLIEILENPEKEIKIEQIEDIDYQDYVIQVKHRETQSYNDSKIRKAVVNLIGEFEKNQSQKYCLYCYFNDKSPHKWTLNLSDLDKILGKEKERYSDSLKENFLKNFLVRFSDDYESQFRDLLKLIESSFRLNSKEMASIYHSIFRSRLLDISIRKIKEQRKISKNDLDIFLQDTEKTIFYESYKNYLEIDKFCQVVKKEYFTFKKVNIDKFERLFLIECEKEIEIVELNRILNRLSEKYFRKDKSPQPYLCFFGIDIEKINELKRDLVDNEILFNDGTYFNGDKFRLDMVTRKDISKDAIKIKIIHQNDIQKVLDRVNIKEIFQFYLNSPLEIKNGNFQHIKIQIQQVKYLLKMI